MTESTVCFTFDFDAISAWLTSWSSGREHPSKVDISRGEFGARVGAPRVLDMLKKYDINSTWFIPGHTADTFPDICTRIHTEGHEIGYHGYAHEADPPPNDESRILDHAISSIRRVTGRSPVGYRFPGLDLADYTIENIIERHFQYDSSLMGDDFHPYRVRKGDRYSLDEPYRFGTETSLVEIPFSWYLDDWPAFSFSWEPFRYAFTSVDTIYDYWKRHFDYMQKNVKCGIFTLCTHPQVIGRAHLITMLEDLIRHMRQTGNVRFCQMQQVADEYNEQNPLGSAMIGSK
jgi:peptidoglycan/xylan/chitin deacetylase (PgdA/CDA1 family)